MILNLSALVEQLPGARLTGSPDVAVSDVSYDSRQTRNGDLFACIRGLEADGHDYAGEAVRRGARALLVERPLDIPVPQVVVQDARRALLLASRLVTGAPVPDLRVVGVTGTNGKTTVTYLTRHLLLGQNWPVGLVGTVENVVGGRTLPVVRTTPESRDLYHLLAGMGREGDRAAVLEVSSHALSLFRVDPEDINVAVFTNLSQDHLDFHGNMERYFEAKLSLFRHFGGMGELPAAVVNASDPRGKDVALASAHPVITYGPGPGPDLGAEDVVIHPSGSRFHLRYQGQRWAVNLPLAGDFNVSNALAAAGAALCLGMDPGDIASRLSRAPSVPGRFEQVETGTEFTVVVDYAHTPDGLENVLRTARRISRGKVMVVFGCGGDRDRDKRPQMGALAARLADISVITSDNPRSEDPDSIISDIERGFLQAAEDGAGGVALVEADRTRAIALALDRAEPGDLIVIAGKGHETYQVFKDHTIDFDDRAVVTSLLEGGTGQ